MLPPRIIPILLLHGGGLVKTERFKNPTYLGDPINAVRIFNDKEVDELMFLDIEATAAGRGPNFDVLSDIASEAFMPFGYGGGITSLEQVRRLLGLGTEKVVLNSVVGHDAALVEGAAKLAGSSSVVVSIDVRRSLLGKYTVYVRGGHESINVDPVVHATRMEALGAGEIMIQSIDRDGTQQGYDLDLVRRVSAAVSVPVIAAGGAGRIEDFALAISAGASAAAAGSFFVFRGKHRAVLITYPDPKAIREAFQ